MGVLKRHLDQISLILTFQACVLPVLCLPKNKHLDWEDFIVFVDDYGGISYMNNFHFVVHQNRILKNQKRTSVNE